MSLVRNKLIPAILASLTTFSIVQAAELTTSFQGWLGHSQKSEYIDEQGPWAACYSGNRDDCIEISVATATSQCYEESYDLGVGFELPMPSRWGGGTLSGSKGSSWSTCHERSVTMTCKPRPHGKVRAAILVGERWGKARVTGGRPALYDHDGTCPKYWNHTARAAFKYLISQCEYSGAQFDKDGWLPEFQYSTCDQEPL